MSDYSKGKIYLIEDENGDKYVGSTVQTLLRRHNKHKTNKKKCSSTKLNLQKSTIILLENYPCETKEQLEWRERKWQDKIKCVNEQRARISHEEKKEYLKNFGQVNKVKNNNNRKQWRYFKNSW